MKISEITEAPRVKLNANLTVIISEESKRALSLIATVKGRTLSEVAREIIDGFLANNKDEIQKIDAALGA